ncbi:MAG: hypothetical protein KBS57_03335, partial [Alistipes sp.]|nr:hypothetical protein [Candidatus Minthomonas equi]
MNIPFIALAAILIGIASQPDRLQDNISPGIQTGGKIASPTWMWHPGQLAAHLQAENRKESKLRCSYVGYPGNSYKISDTAIFVLQSSKR